MKTKWLSPLFSGALASPSQGPSLSSTLEPDGSASLSTSLSHPQGFGAQGWGHSWSQGPLILKALSFPG